MSSSLTAATRPGSPPSGPDTAIRSPLPWLTLAAVVVVLNETAMVNAMPHVMADFAVSPRTAQWLTTAFLLSMATVIPATGWLLSRLTPRSALRGAMTVFALGTAVCALAPSFAVLVAGRVVQATGTAVMMPLLITTVLRLVPADRRGHVMGRVMMAIAVAPALGPALSGSVLTVTSWRAIFVLVMALAAAVTAIGLRRLDTQETAQRLDLDVLSLALAAAGFAPLVYGFSLLGSGSVRQLLLVVGSGLLGVAAFAVRQRLLERDGTPLLDLRTLTRRAYRVGVLTAATAFMILIGALVVLSLYLQEVRGLPALRAGLLVVPGGVVMGLLGPRVGRLADRSGARRVAVPGTLVALAALLGLSRLGEHQSL